jgi:DICT domain-containing protein
MTSLTSAPSGGLPSAFDLVAHLSTPVRRTKRELLAASRAVERTALGSGATSVLVTFQDKRHLTEASRAAYGRLARQGAQVHAFARGLTSDYRPDSQGLVHVALMPDDPLVSEWDIVVEGPAGSTAFVARDLDPGAEVVGADLDRPFSWTQTEDPAVVAEVAAALRARIPVR